MENKRLVDYLNENKDKQIVVFGAYLLFNTIQQDNPKLKMGLIAGPVSKKQRKKNIEKYNDGKINILFFSVPSLLDGIRLKHYDAAIFAYYFKDRVVLAVVNRIMQHIMMPDIAMAGKASLHFKRSFLEWAYAPIFNCYEFSKCEFKNIP